MRRLTLEEKIGQVLMIWCRASFLNVENPEYLQLLEAMRKYHVGSFAMSVHVDGPYLLRSEPYEAAELLNRLQRESKLPLLFAADFERGVSMRLMGTTVFPHAMAFGGDGDTADAERFGRITAEEARAIGIHWNFFPDADVTQIRQIPSSIRGLLAKIPNRLAIWWRLTSRARIKADADHCETFSRPRRHRYRLASGRGQR